jgi:hypothetical protein
MRDDASKWVGLVGLFVWLLALFLFACLVCLIAVAFSSSDSQAT